MINPWLKKNPFMRMWMSAANQAVNRARGHVTAAVRRETNKAAADVAAAGIKHLNDLWSGTLLRTPTAPTKRRKAKKAG